MSYLRTLAAFLYTTIITSAYTWLSIYIVTKAIVYISGFWHTLFVAIAFLYFFSWLSERGIELLSIPYNWLWDRTLKTRIATAIPVILVGLWCISMPIRIPVTFSVSNWVLVIIWELLSIPFFYNLLVLPFINPNMGIGCRQDQD